MTKKKAIYGTFDGEWFWGDSVLPHLDYYNYLGISFTYIGYCNMHYKNSCVKFTQIQCEVVDRNTTPMLVLDSQNF